MDYLFFKAFTSSSYFLHLLNILMQESQSNKYATLQFKNVVGKIHL